MRWFVGLCVVAACGPKAPPAEPLDNADLAHPPPVGELPRRTAKAERPAIDISAYTPDFHDELRWPLSGMSHPVLEPRFDVAQELADPGIGWQELCARGVQNRVSATQKELLSYLHGWCDVDKGDIDGACTYLAPLIGSTMRNLTPAVRLDLANILASGSADKAEHWLNKHNIRDIPMLDLLAANYAEQGLLHDGAIINQRIIDSDDHATEATKCRRLTRQIAMHHDSDQTMAFMQLEQLAKKPTAPDPLCVTLFHKAECVRNPDNCSDFFDDEKIDHRAAALMKAYAVWPWEGTYRQWWWVVASARYAVGMPDADELLMTALDAAFRAEGGCPDASTEVHEVVKLMVLAQDARYQSRLKEMAAMCHYNWEALNTPLPAPPTTASAATTTAPALPRLPQPVTGPTTNAHAAGAPAAGAPAAETPVPAPTEPKAAPEPARPGPPPTLAPSTKSITPPSTTPTTNP